VLAKSSTALRKPVVQIGTEKRKITREQDDAALR